MVRLSEQRAAENGVLYWVRLKASTEMYVEDDSAQCRPSEAEGKVFQARVSLKKKKCLGCITSTNRVVHRFLSGTI
jgi:hypothetical protein